MRGLTGRGPPRRHKSSRLYPDVAPEKSRQPVRKLAALQTNPINVPSAGKSDKSSRYQRSLSPEADTTSHGAKYVSFALKYLSSHHMRPRWWRWLQLKETGTCPSCLPLLSVDGRLHLGDQSALLVPVILHYFHPAAPLLDQQTATSVGFSALLSEDHFPHQETHF